MAKSFSNETVETSSTTGTGTYSLAGAPSGSAYRTFRQEFSNGETKIVYVVRNASSTKYEINRFGTLTYGSPDTLSRNVVKSSNSDAAVSWVSGDLPLTLYVTTIGEVLELVLTGGLGSAVSGWLRFGDWHKDAYPSSGWVTKYLYDGADSIALGKLNTTQNKYIPDPDAILYPPGYIQGLTYSNNSGDPTNYIDIAAGVAVDATGAYPMKLSSTLTKRLDAAWAVGNNQGARDTGSIGNNDYYIWLIARSDTGVVDVLFSLSSTSPTMPTNYDYKRLIGWFKRVSGAIVEFKTFETAGGGLELRWNTPTLDVNLSNTLGTSRRTDALKVPLNFSTEAIFDLVLGDATNSLARICCPDETDGAVGNLTAPLINAGSPDSNGRGDVMIMRTSSDGKIAARSYNQTIDYYLVSTLGFRWSRRP